MGREAEAWVTFDGQSGQAKLLLESDHLLLRGAVRGKIARADLSDWAVEGAWLQITTPQGPLRAELGAKVAAAWAKALAKPPPTLAQKLGIAPETPVQILTPLTDAALLAACNGAIVAQSPLGLAEFTGPSDIASILAQLEGTNLVALWCVTQKGKAAPFPEATLRSALRERSWIDTKTAAISPEFTATRYNRRVSA